MAPESGGEVFARKRFADFGGGGGGDALRRFLTAIATSCLSLPFAGLDALMAIEESAVFEFDRGLCSAASERLCDAFEERFDGERDGENEGRVEFDRDLSTPGLGKAGKVSTSMRNPDRARVGAGVGVVDEVEDMLGVASAASGLGTLGRGGKVDWAVSGTAGDGARDMLCGVGDVWCVKTVAVSALASIVSTLYILLFSSPRCSFLTAFARCIQFLPSYPLIKLYGSPEHTYSNYVTHIQYVTVKILCIK